MTTPTTNYPLAIVMCFGAFACQSSVEQADTDASVPGLTDSAIDSAVDSPIDSAIESTDGGGDSAAPDTGVPPEDPMRTWIHAMPWSNFEFGSTLDDEVNLSFRVRAGEDNIDAVVALTDAVASEYDDLAVIVRLNAEGFFDVRDGSEYRADEHVTYERGDVYLVELDIDFAGGTFDAFVSDAAGRRSALRLGAEFRDSNPASSATYLVMHELNDDVAISEFAIGGVPTELVWVDPDDIDVPIPNPDLPIVAVSNTAELNSAMEATRNGGTIQLRAGTYDCFRITDRMHTRAAPLVFQGLEDGVVFTGSCAYPLEVLSSRYLAFRNIAVVGGTHDSVRIVGSSHVILDEMSISQSGLAGIHVKTRSYDIDIINSVITNTGVRASRFGECIYIGDGQESAFPDVNERIWIENNTISNCGNGEGIDIKVEVFNATIRGNHVSNISPGTSVQFNQAAIAIGSARSDENYEPSRSREAWIENNVVENVNGGRFNNGIQAVGNGVYVLGNELRNIGDAGIYVNGYNTLGFPVYIHGNVLNGNSTNYSSDVEVRLQAPPNENPNSPQNWLP